MSQNFRGKFFSNLGIQSVNLKNTEAIFNENIVSNFFIFHP